MNLPAPWRDPRLLLPFLVWMAAPACGIFDEGTPETARVVLGGPTGHPVVLVTSLDFDAVTRADGDGRDVTIFSADTAAVSIPLDQRYGLGPRSRILVIAASDSSTASPVRMQVYIDGDLRFDRTTQFADGEELQFVFAAASSR